MAEHDRTAAEDEEEEDPVYVVADENGAERELIPVYSFDYRNNKYVVLIDRNDPEADGVILRMERDGEEIVLANIEDDEEWDAVVGIYNGIAGGENG